MDEEAPADGWTLEELLAGGVVNERQEAAWAGTQVDARQLLFEREAARANKALLGEAVEAYWRVWVFARQGQRSVGSPVSALTRETVSEICALVEGAGGAEVALSAMEYAAPQIRPWVEGIRLFCRIRPTEARPLAVERRASADVVCHDGRLTRSGRTLRVTHHVFETDGVFDARNETKLETQVFEPLARAVTGDGPSYAALILYGQTGSGKTHTLKACLETVLEHAAGTRLALRCVELAGTRLCRDLLADGAAAKLLSDADGRVRLKGAKRIVGAPADLRPVLDAALKFRASRATERNADSSRSHAIVEVTRCLDDRRDDDDDDGPSSDAVRLERALVLCDLAGSEQRWETMQATDKEFTRQSAFINGSLMALKDCFRAARANADSVSRSRRLGKSRIPFRASYLTRLLSRAFEPDARVALVATVSATVDDVLHSVHTLDIASLMRPRVPSADGRALEAGRGSETKPSDSAPRKLATERLILRDVAGAKNAAWLTATHPLEWSAQETRSWLLTTANGKFRHVVLPPGVTGKDLLKWDARRLGNLFESAAESNRAARVQREGATWVVGADQGAGVGRDLFAAIRREAARASTRTRPAPI